MRNSRAASTRWLSRIAACMALTHNVACAIPDGPAGPATRLPESYFAARAGDVEPDSAPFYYYTRHDRYPLTADPSEFVVATTQPVDELQIQELLKETGVTPTGLRELPQMPNHWLVELRGNSGYAPARAISQRLRASSLISFAEPSYYAGSRDARTWFVNRLVVRFRETVVNESQLQEFMQANKLELERAAVPESSYFNYRFRMPAGLGGRALVVAAVVKDHPLVEWAAVDGISQGSPAFVPTDPYYSLQYHLKSTNFYAAPGGSTRVDINVEGAWDRTKGAGTRIAILDDGAQLNHPDLSHMFPVITVDYFSDAECDGDPWFPAANDVHGTGIAGIIGAAHNSTGVAGIAPAADIVLARITCYTNQPPPPKSYLEATHDEFGNAMTWAAVSLNSHVINFSFGWQSTVQFASITQAVADVETLGRGGKGTVLVAAAGNRSSAAATAPVDYPARLPTVLAVGALKPTGPRADYSNGGPELDLVAPSSLGSMICTGGILTTEKPGTAGCSPPIGPPGEADSYFGFGGTSAAAPQVAAVAALILSRNPSLTAAQVRERLKSTAVPWGGSTWWYGAGKLNASAAVP